MLGCTCRCPSVCTGRRACRALRRSRPRSSAPGTPQDRNTALEAGEHIKVQVQVQVQEQVVLPGAEQVPPFMHCGEQTGRPHSSPSQPGLGGGVQG